MARPLAYVLNADDPRQQAYAARKIARATTALADAIRATLQTPAGRVVFAALFELGGLDDAGFEASARYQAYREGRRSLAKDFRELADAADEAALALLETERRSRQKRDNEETAAARLSWAEAAAADPYR